MFRTSSTDVTLHRSDSPTYLIDQVYLDVRNSYLGMYSTTHLVLQGITSSPTELPETDVCVHKSLGGRSHIFAVKNQQVTEFSLFAWKNGVLYDSLVLLN